MNEGPTGGRSHSLAFANHFTLVHAFEPNPNVFRVLQINANLKSNITTHMVGCSSSEAEIAVVERRGNLGSTGIGLPESNHAKERVIFHVAPLDLMKLFDENDRVSFVKIDVEGHEAETIRGAANTYLQHQPVIAMEVGRKTVSNGSNAALDALKELGYSYFYEIPRAHDLRRLLHNRASKVLPVNRLEKRNYPLFLAATKPFPLET